MWRLSQSSPRDVLRLGRLAAERWQARPEGLVCVASQPFPPAAGDRFAPVPRAIETLFSQPGDARVTVVLESAWVPVMLAETGRAVWRRPEVEALLRHRFAQLYDDPADPVSEWDVRVDHRAGDARALGYGFSPRLRAALGEAARLVGRSWTSWVPAWTWGWQRARPERRWAGKTGHWAWQEQDRLLVGSFEAGAVVALDAAAAVCGSQDAVVREVALHAARSGLPAVGWPVVAASMSGVTA